MAQRAAAQSMAAEGSMPLCAETKAFDAAEFGALSRMIGEDGAFETVEIFRAETKRRLRRLAKGDQDIATQFREMHTLKGGASTVAAPRLAVMGLLLERAAYRGIVPAPDQIEALDAALEDYLAELSAWSSQRMRAA